MNARVVWKIMLGFYIALFFAFLFGPLVIMGVTAFNIPSYPQVWPFEGFTLDWFVKLAADRNFPSCNLPTCTPNPTIGLIPFTTGARWGIGLHNRKGNVLFSDGHVEESHDSILSSEETVDNYLFYPDVNEATNVSTSAPNSYSPPAGRPGPAGARTVRHRCGARDDRNGPGDGRRPPDELRHRDGRGASLS